MRRFDLYEIEGALYLLVQSDHLLDLNSVVVLPALPSSAHPALSKLTVDVTVRGVAYRILAHMPLTLPASRLQPLKPRHRLSPDEGQRVMDGLNTILWGF